MVFVGPENAGMAWTKVFRPLWPRTPIVLMTTSYASRTASELARMGDGIYAMAEFDPWSASSLASTDWRRLMLKKKLPLSSLSQGGYLAAQMLVRQLFTIRGAITRTTVSEALRAMPAWNSGMTHMPLRVDARGNHELNRSGLPMQLQHGRWRIAHPTWITH
jgi:branched-chain amino acid transport system substrate-binding protein